jgi:tyrosine-protein kinase Etk/Wzc
MKTEFEPRLDVASLLRTRFRTFAACAAVGIVLSAAYVLIAPPWYEAKLVVVPSQRSQMPGMAMPMSLSGLASLASGFGADVERIVAVLETNAVADATIAKFGLMKRYDVDYIEDARKQLWKHCWTKVDKKASVVTLACEDRDPERARDLAAYIGAVGNRIFGRISVSSANEERQFLETQVQKARQDAEAASRKLREFQEKHKIVDVGEQSRAVISAMASVKAEMLSKQLQLSYLEGFSSPTEGSVLKLKQQVGVLSAKLEELEARPTALEPAGQAAAAGTLPSPASDSGFFPKAMSVPELRYQLEPLMREQKVQEMVLLLLTQRYETAKVDEARDTSTFQILDEPTVPTLRSRPKRLLSVLLGALGGLLVAYVWLVAPTYLRRRLRVRVEGTSKGTATAREVAD